MFSLLACRLGRCFDPGVAGPLHCNVLHNIKPSMSVCEARPSRSGVLSPKSRASESFTKWVDSLPETYPVLLLNISGIIILP